MGGWGNIPAALLAAVLWGIGDFSGGMGVRTAGGRVGAALRVLLLSHLTSLCVLLLLASARGDVFPHGRLLAWGLAAGVVGGLSLTAFYVSLARGAMGASAAISGVLAAAIPALLSSAVEGAPGWRKGLGFLIAGVAIWMIAAGESAAQRASTMGLAIAAGAGFGCYFICLKFAGPAGVVWPMATARMGSITTCALILLALRGAEPARLTRRIALCVLGTALFDTSGNMLFIVATRSGRLDVASVLASLYPASTILMAAWMMQERPTLRQGWGMAVAGLAVILIAA